MHLGIFFEFVNDIYRIYEILFWAQIIAWRRKFLELTKEISPLQINENYLSNSIVVELVRIFLKRLLFIDI